MLPRGVKIGHGGTLDRFATGILLLLIGKATRQFEQITSLKKTYDATIKLGFNTPTDDPESPELPYIVEPTSGVRTIDGDEPVQTLLKPSFNDIELAATRFIGLIEQTPPAFSALKISGQRSCDLARRGTPVDVRSRTVQIHTFTVNEYTWPEVKVSIECGRGTYIRSIARSLGDSLQTGGYLTQLRRTRVGPFSLQDAVSLDQLRGVSILNAIHRCTTTLNSV